jgi:hypothetical protein
VAHPPIGRGQKFKKIILANIDAGNMKFGQNVYFCPGRTNNLKNDVFWRLTSRFFLSPRLELSETSVKNVT